MLFCNACGGILIPKKSGSENHVECRQCGLTFDEEGIEVSISDTNTKQESIDVIEDSESLPTMEAQCEKCDNNTVYWWMQQTRASDEPETRFFKCTECSYTWREYD